MRACFALGRISGRRRGDHDLNPDRIPAEGLKAAAVLIPIVLRDPEPTILLTLRADGLSNHPGQISFPGGGVERDETPSQAALREAWEEIGLPADRVEILGGLDHYVTVSGFTVAPVVGLVSPPLDLAAAQGEVAEILEVPLSFFVDAKNRIIEQREFQGVTHAFYVFDTGLYRIWGATAGMMANFVDFMQAAA